MSYTASPAVRAYAGRMGVDLDSVAAACGREALAREDVERHLNGGNGGAAAAPAPASAAPAGDPSRYWQVDHARFGAVEETPLPRFAQVAAANLAAANTMIPQVTHHDRADMRAVEALRKRLRPEGEARGVKLTALAFHAKALARCLTDMPAFNASLSPDGKTLVQKRYVHVGLAVDTPHGLMVPVVRDADRKGVWQIAAEIADLAARARDRKVSGDEMGGASMTISSLGGIGGQAFTPIVNPPEAAILGITRTETVPVWEDGDWRPVPMVPLDLSYDHRLINGAQAAAFLARYAALLADPRRIMV